MFGSHNNNVMKMRMIIIVLLLLLFPLSNGIQIREIEKIIK